MELWNGWTGLLQHTLELLAGGLGLPQALAIVVLTLVARLAFMPFSWRAAVASHRNRDALAALKPELERLKTLHANDQAALARATMALYREHGITLLGRDALLNLGWQGLFGLGLFQVLRSAVWNGKFLWVASLARPDVLLSLLVGALMALSMALAPGASAEPAMLFMLAVSVAICCASLFALPSAVGVYWATSNTVSLGQSLALRVALRGQGRVS